MLTFDNMCSAKSGSNKSAYPNDSHSGARLPCVAVCCSVLQCVAVCCKKGAYTNASHSRSGSYLVRVFMLALYRKLSSEMTFDNMCQAKCGSKDGAYPNDSHSRARLPCVAVCCRVLQCVAVCCSVLQCVAVCCSVLQCVAKRAHM